MTKKNKDVRSIRCRNKFGMTAKNEQGRSMTEMLGTLAIIGVLSVGSIAGYRYAMDNYYTNEILNALSQRAVVLSSQSMSGRELSLREFDGHTIAGGTIETNVEKLNGEFGIKLTGVKGSVCERLIEIVSDAKEIQAITKADNSEVLFTKSDCQEENNSFLVIYSSDFGSEATESSKSRCLESEKIRKYYFTGDCCDTQESRVFCPDESVPKCSISESNLELCKSDCQEFWDHESNLCCNTGNESDWCCQERTGNPDSGLNNNGYCCLGGGL